LVQVDYVRVVDLDIGASKSDIRAISVVTISERAGRTCDPNRSPPRPLAPVPLAGALIPADAAVETTAGMIDAKKKSNGTARSEALQSSILEIIDKKRHQEWVHPNFWSGYAIVEVGQLN
jgi:hypothetical protein